MNLTDNLPSPSVPMLTPDGRISQVWWQLFISLFTRTGGAQGFDVAALIQRAVLLEAKNAELEAKNAALQAQIDAIPLPTGYSNVTIAGTARKIPYYSN